MRFSYVPVPTRFLCYNSWWSEYICNRLNERGLQFLEENGVEVVVGYSRFGGQKLFFVMEHEDAVIFKLKESDEENL